MNLKVGDSVLYIDDDTSQLYRYEVHWINDQDTTEEYKSIIEYRKAYLEMLGK
jgi:hypothetical protein